MNTAPFPQLQAFLAVARLRSFTSAARELGVTRSAVSQAVQQLEQQLRVVLLARTTRSVSVTEAGRSLLEGAGPALAQLAAALNQVSAKPGEAVGKLRLSVPRTAVPFVIDPVLPTFRARHPRVEVEIVIEERLVDIVAEGYDPASASARRSSATWSRCGSPTRSASSWSALPITSRAAGPPGAPRTCCGTSASRSGRRRRGRCTSGSWSGAAGPGASRSAAVW